MLSYLSLGATENSDYPNHNDTMKKIRDLYVHLFWSPETATQPDAASTDLVEEPLEKKSKVDELKDFLEKKKESAERDRNDRGNFSSPATILSEI